MPAPPSDARAHLGRVLGVETCGADGAILTVRTISELAPIRASRFFMLGRTDGVSPLIPRPFSIYRQRGRDLDFLIKITGRGTRALAGAASGTEIRLTGPLGNGWPTLEADGAPWVFMAGGVGSAPFYMAIEQALAGMDGRGPVPRKHISFLFGAAQADHLYDLEALGDLGVSIHTATDDGSSGFHGTVLGLLDRLQGEGTIAQSIRICACGPEPMLRAVEELARARDVEAYLSLETLMGCGVGICNGCPVPTRPEGPLGAWPNAKCCVEGPVFAADAITLAGVE